MTRLEKGGIRLRLVTALAAVTVIAAGVYAAYGSAPQAALTVSHLVVTPDTLDYDGITEVKIYLNSQNTAGGQQVYLQPVNYSSGTPDLAGWVAAQFPSGTTMPSNRYQSITTDASASGNLKYDSVAGKYYVLVELDASNLGGSAIQTKLNAANDSADFPNSPDASSGLIIVNHQ